MTHEPNAPAQIAAEAASRLAHVRWIGGGSGAGKSTIARRLADEYELLVYSTDVALAFEARGFTWEIPNRSTDPQRALANVLRRDELFTDDVADEAEKLGLQMIRIEVGLTIDEATALVGSALGCACHSQGLPAGHPSGRMRRWTTTDWTLC